MKRSLFGFLRSGRRPRFQYVARTLSDTDYRLLADRPGWRPQRLAVAPGIELRGLLRQATHPAGPWILFFAGNSGSLLHEGQQVLEALCEVQGWGGVVWAYRGFDSSGGVPDPIALENDGVMAWSQLLSSQRIGPDAVHLIGFSLGTSIAAAVAAHASRTPPASLTLLAPMTELYVGDRIQFRLHRYETTRWLAGIANRTLVIHGSQDTALPVENGRAVARALGSRARLLELPGLGHSELPLSPAALDAMRAFISGNTAAAPP